ncbi:MAG: hemerythrin domain-containing protein [Candidatus Rokubacteria bacterium]|nr:hemerythrin domain-containing protein [Candidatus Rokubacteria bacterium]
MMRDLSHAAATAMLRHEHEVILRALTLLERVGQGLEAGPPVDRAALTWLIDFFRTFADRCHHGKEEQHLFPALERHGVPREGGPLGVMLQEHEDGRAFLRATTQGDDRARAEAVRGYVALLRAHIDKENEILFPIAEQVLAEEEQRVLAQAFEAVEQVVVGPGIHERLLAKLAELEGK